MNGDKNSFMQRTKKYFKKKVILRMDMELMQNTEETL